MLGRVIADPDGLEGPAGDTEGLGLLDIETIMHADKTLRSVSATHCTSGLQVDGYEIHLGQTDGPDCARPFAMIEGRPDGASSPDGRVQGSYLHGLFSADAFRQAFLTNLNGAPMTFGALAYDDMVDQLSLIHI